jgi:hypothetical protein
MMRLIIRAWRPTLSGMADKKRFWIRAVGADGLELVGWRRITARTERGAVAKLARWMEWEGYDIDNVCVHIEESTKNG